MKELTQKQINCTVKSLLEHAQGQIEEVEEYTDAVFTIGEAIKVLDGDYEIAKGYWEFCYECTPLDVFKESEIEIMIELGIHIKAEHND